MNAILLINAVSARLLWACVKRRLWVGGCGRWYLLATRTNHNPTFLTLAWPLMGLLVSLHTPAC